MPTTNIEMRLDILYRMMMTDLHLEDPALVKSYCNHCMSKWDQLADKDKDFVNRAYACIVKREKYG